MVQARSLLGISQGEMRLHELPRAILWGVPGGEALWRVRYGLQLAEKSNFESQF